MIRTNASRVYPICKDWSDRFIQAYDAEFAEWINSVKASKLECPTAWDGMVGQITASAASKARDTQTKTAVEIPPTPDFYK